MSENKILEEAMAALSGEAGDNWDVLEDLINPKDQPEFSSEEANLMQSYARLFSTPDGRRVFEDLQKKTRDASTWWPATDATPTMDQVTAYGLMREGQNALFASIGASITRGHEILNGKNKS